MPFLIIPLRRGYEVIHPPLVSYTLAAILALRGGASLLFPELRPAGLGIAEALDASPQWFLFQALQSSFTLYPNVFLAVVVLYLFLVAPALEDKVGHGALLGGFVGGAAVTTAAGLAGAFRLSGGFDAAWGGMLALMAMAYVYAPAAEVRCFLWLGFPPIRGFFGYDRMPAGILTGVLQFGAILKAHWGEAHSIVRDFSAGPSPVYWAFFFPIVLGFGLSAISRHLPKTSGAEDPL